jgi:hypothetical protein
MTLKFIRGRGGEYAETRKLAERILLKISVKHSELKEPCQPYTDGILYVYRHLFSVEYPESEMEGIFQTICNAFYGIALIERQTTAVIEPLINSYRISYSGPYSRGYCITRVRNYWGSDHIVVYYSERRCGKFEDATFYTKEEVDKVIRGLVSCGD